MTTAILVIVICMFILVLWTLIRVNYKIFEVKEELSQHYHDTQKVLADKILGLRGEVSCSLRTFWETVGQEVRYNMLKELFYNGITPENESKKSPLRDPANHDLEVLFKELKFGRPAASQKYLDKCIAGLSEETYDDLFKIGDFVYRKHQQKLNRNPESWDLFMVVRVKHLTPENDPVETPTTLYIVSHPKGGYAQYTELELVLADV